MRRAQPTELKLTGGMPGIYHLQRSTQPGLGDFTNLAVLSHSGYDSMITNASEASLPAVFYRALKQ